MVFLLTPNSARTQPLAGVESKGQTQITGSTQTTKDAIRLQTAGEQRKIWMDNKTKVLVSNSFLGLYTLRLENHYLKSLLLVLSTINLILLENVDTLFPF